MSSILKTVEWSKPALKILSYYPELDPTLPTIIHLRHTEREMNPLGTPKGYSSPSTEQGKQAAYELGTMLPTNKKYRLYHTRIERTKETATEIQKGLTSNNCEAELVGSIPLSIVLDRAKFMENSRQENSLGLGLQEIGTRWLGGIYSPSVRVLSHEFAQRMASLMMDNLKTADRFSFVVYVSHEVYIAAFMFHWFGIYPSEWVEFLEGFILQLTEDKMIVYTKNGKQELYYPYWWNF